VIEKGGDVKEAGDLTKEDLVAFEVEMAQLFEAAQIHAPVHLSGGNEDDLIRIFQHVKPTDWVFSTHRSHYHALLKGISKEWLKAEILAGHSITLNNREHKFFSSAIVGGILPIAVGVAMTGETTWCFVGDMAGSGGIFFECYKYAIGHDLPITFVIEDNGWSVNSPTKEVWGSKLSSYEYLRQYPHVGSGKWVTF